MRSFTMFSAAAVLCGVVGVAGCASQGPKPTEELTKAHTLIQEAEKAQAQRYAAPDLQRARDELSSAEVANTKGDYDVARSNAESAAVDADVAMARASAGEALRAAHEAQQSNSVLQRESERATQGGTSSSAAPPAPRSDLQAYPPVSSAPPAPPPPEASPPEPQANPQ
jgi:Domain of unknown function (DUF4398)